MKNFIFISPEGETKTPTGEDIENLQVLGFGRGVDAAEACRAFLRENSFVSETGFEEVICLELSSEEESHLSLSDLSRRGE